MTHSYDLIIIVPSSLRTQAIAYAASLREPKALSFSVALADDMHADQMFAGPESAALASGDAATLLAATAPDAIDAEGQPWTLDSVAALRAELIVSAVQHAQTPPQEHFAQVLADNGLAVAEGAEP